MKKMPVLCTLLVFIFLFTLSACSEKKSLWREDYDFFWRTIEENYPYAAAIERINGKNLAEVKEKYTPSADKAESAEELHAVLEDCMGEFPELTGHFNLMHASTYRFYMDVSFYNPDDGKLQFIRKELDTPQSRTFYSYKEPEEASNMGDEQAMSFGNLEIKYLQLPKSGEKREYAGYVAIHSMLPAWENDDAARWANFWVQLNELDSKECIIDIRGNGGGDDGYWVDNVVAPNISTELGEPHIALVCGRKSVDYLEHTYGETIPTIKTLDTTALTALIPDDLALATHYTESCLTVEPSGDTPIFNGRFWLLVDEAVYSSSEAFAIFCKDTGFATIVGTGTGGDGIGIDPLAVTLPNSGIAFRFSTMFGLNSDGSCNEEVGTIPDIICEPGEDALDLCLRAIKEGK